MIKSELLFSHYNSIINVKQYDKAYRSNGIYGQGFSRKVRIIKKFSMASVFVVISTSTDEAKCLMDHARASIKAITSSHSGNRGVTRAACFYIRLSPGINEALSPLCFYDTQQPLVLTMTLTMDYNTVMRGLIRGDPLVLLFLFTNLHCRLVKATLQLF